MKLRLIMSVAAAAVLASSLSACSTLGGGSSAVDVLKQLNENYARCERHITYQAGVGVVTPGASISGSVNCPAETPAGAVATGGVVGGAAASAPSNP